MQKTLWSSVLHLVTGGAAILLAATAVTGARAEPADAKAKQKADELARVHQRIEEVNKSIEVDRDQRDALRSVVEQAERRLAEAQAQIRKIQALVDQQTARMKLAQDDRNLADRRLASQREALASQLRAAYILGTGGKTALLLSQDDPDRVGRMMAYYDYISRFQRHSIETINASIDHINELQSVYQKQLDALRDLQAQRSAALAELESDRASRRAAMAQMQSRIEGESEELKHLQASEKQIQSLLDSLNRPPAEAPLQTGAQRPFPEMRGRLQWPLRGNILARYGESKAGRSLLWKGLWIGVAEGTPVHACAAGRVAYVGWLSSFGLIMVIEHEQNYFTLYAHNASVAKAAGDKVAAGETIAAAGNTGGYEEPGLYFEIRKGTDSLDPQEWLAR